MRTKSPEKRSRQKQSRQQSYRVETERNPETTPQYFQISVNVLEARKLTWMSPHSANSYVIVVLGKKKHRTSIRRNMQEPYYREHFMFELYVTISEIQRSSLWLAVMEPRCCAPPRLMGEANIDLGAVWSQPHHQVFHKWAQLSLPRNPTAGSVGFLKVDISIIFRGDIQVMPVVVNNERVEDNLLLPSGSEQQPANYIVTIYGAFGLPNGATGPGGDRRYGKLPSTFVRVSFCGLSAKTAVQPRNNHPTYCEQISIVEMFPNLTDIIRLEVCSGDGVFNRVLASAHLRLGQISHDGENGFLPTFGPSLLHMYGTSTSGTLSATGEEGPYHRGAMLVSLRTVVPYYQQGLRSTSVEPVSALHPDCLWLMEDFCVFCPILEVSMLDRRIAGKVCGVAVTVGELPTDDQGDEDFVAMMSEIKNRKLYYTGSMEVQMSKPVNGYLDFENTFPVLQLATRLPDFRFRMYRNNMVYGIVADLEQSLKEVERRLKNSEYDSLRELTEDLSRATDDTAGNILKFLDIVQYSNPCSSTEQTMVKYSTELDAKQLALQKEEIEKIYHQITKKAQRYTSALSLIQAVTNTESTCNTKKDVKMMIAETKAIAESLRNLIYKTSEGWPDIVIWLLNGGSRVAHYKIPIADIIFSVIPEQNGRNCGRIQNIYFKPLKCPKHMNTLATGCCCIAGKVELILWMGLYRQIHTFESCLPKGYKLKVKDYDMCLKSSTMMLECRVFIYRAKLNSSADKTSLAYPFVRINTLNTVKETKVAPRTLTPVWNQVLKIHKLVSATPDRIVNSPPLVMIEVLDGDSTLQGRSELIGRFQIQPTVDDRQDYEYAPKLQWYDIHKGAEYTGQILLSVQLLQIPETLMKNTVYGPVEETYVASGFKATENDNDEPESLPSVLIPKSTTYKVDIYWWGLRDVTTTRKPCVVLEMDELTIKSDVVSDKKSNCNFPNGRSSQTFQAPLNEVYCPPLSIRLYDSSTFGRTLFLGTNVVKNPNKYIVSWIPKIEREASLRSVSITASNFFQVSQVLYIKKSNTPSAEEIGSKNSLKTIQKTKRSRWKRLFCSKEADEEEYILLPIFCKNKSQIKLAKTALDYQDCKDWWMRYFASQTEEVDDNVPSDRITMYANELETQPEFSKFKDWCTTLKLYSGKKTGIPEKDEQLYCGYLKAGIAIYRWPPPDNTVAVSCHGVELNYGFFNDYPSNETSKFLVRVYVVRGVNLVAKAFTGKLDPYVAISCGNKHLGDRKNHVKNTLNPIFGRMYEFRCTLPDDYLLTVSLYDYEAIPPDELIGSTTIDLEDRIYSKHGARVGLSMEYNTTGSNKWRDCHKPSVILAELCERNHLPPPSFPNNYTVVVNGVEYRDNETNNRTYRTASDRKENICLSLLHSWYTLPICGYRLVPEHVESRSLINPEKNGLEQGKLQMWVDIFPLESDVYIPPAVDITPRKLEDYELRVIIWDVQGVRLDDHGKKVSDIYVRAWIDTIQQAQYTDVHYSSSSGEGSFNWRMIFHFQYHHAEKKLVRKEKGPFTEVEEHMPPIFVVQVLDSDASSQDDFLASRSFNLNSMPRGFKHPQQCTLEDTEKSKNINLFSTVSIRAWWPLIYTNRNTGANSAAGLIHLELSLLPKEKAILMPVGLGREPPAPLPEPSRAESASPLNCLKNNFKLRWRREHILVAVAILVIGLIIFTIWLEVPQSYLDV